eukprot:m.46657 g.46657  ORF g.46657 m.46657 type:complete len:220 (+) comp10933_c0_seq2:222-881(+)
MADFASLEKELAELMVDINKASNALPDLIGGEKDDMLRVGQEAVDEALGVVEQLELAVSDLPSSGRAAAKRNVAAHKASVDEARRKLNKAAVALPSSQAARDSLFARDGSSEDSRATLLTNTQRLDRTSTRLEDAHRVALQTTEVADDIMDNLHSQRETIVRAHGRVRNIDGNVGTSNRLLSGMLTRARRNKLVALLIIVITLALIAGIIYAIVTKHRN